MKWCASMMRARVGRPPQPPEMSTAQVSAPLDVNARRVFVFTHTPFTHQWPPRRSWSGKSAKRSRHNSPCPKRRGTRRLKRYLSNQPTPIHYRVSASQVRLSQQSVGTNPRAGGGAPLSHRQPSRGAPESAGTKRGATCCVLCVETEDDCQTHTVCSSVGWH